MDDTSKPLSEIALQHGKSLVSLLRGVRSATVEKHEIDEFLERLECLHFSPESWSEDLFRHSLDALEGTRADYVALSYTWAPSAGEDYESKGFRIQNRKKTSFYPSLVRNTVFTRASAYMDAHGVNSLWIDRHCIPQQVCRGPCRCRRYRRCRGKRIGLQAMDWVYTRSQHPLALLAWEASSKPSLRLLASIILGRFVLEGTMGPYIWPGKEVNSKAALQLLYDITSDAWWGRAWTFQESHQGGERMNLLMSHRACLEGEKHRLKCLGTVRGEVCINLVKFCTAAARLCDAVESGPSVTRKEKQQLCHIRGRVRHAASPSGVTPTDVEILQDIQDRGIKYPWDRLAIMANCCRFPYRMEIPRHGQRHSLSIAILSMCLRNGVILDNSSRIKDLDLSASRMKMDEAFDALTLKSFPGHLASLGPGYNKGHRFVSTTLKEKGIETLGHIWELGRVIRTRSWRYRRSAAQKKCRRLSKVEYQQLCWLVGQLRRVGACSVATLLSDYLESDQEVFSKEYRFAGDLKLKMAKEVAAAIGRGRLLRVAKPWREPRSTSAGAIFIMEKKASPIRGYPEFTFTSLWPCEDEATYDTDRHASLQVYLERNGRIPHLTTDRGIMGLCFFSNYRRDKVIFPWPPALEEVKH